MKKITALILVCILTLLSFANVFAASGLSATATNNYLKQGDTVTVNAVLSTSETVDNLGISVAYDANVLDFVAAGWSIPNTIVSNYDSVLCYGVAQMTEPAKPNGTVFYITFKVKSNAPITTTTVSLNLTVGAGGEVVGASTSLNISCNHSWGAWKTISEATCTEIGQQERVCSICGAKQQSYIDAKGHSYSDWQTTKEATCTESGEQVRTCSVCGSSQARNVAPAGHTLGEGAEVLKEATCTQHGQAKGKCTVCGQDVTVDTPFAPHKYGNWYTIVQATCTEKGEREHECTVCGHIERQKSLPLGHDFSQGTLVSEATIYSTGLFEAKCTRCGTEGSIISPCSYTDEETHIYLETEEEVFPSGTSVRVKTLGNIRPEEKEVKEGFAKYISQVTEYFKGLYERITGKAAEKDSDFNDYGIGSISSAYDLYEIKAVNVDGDREEQKGPVEITFPIPEGFGRNVAVYAVDEKGIRSDLPADVDMVGKTVKVSSEDLYVFALANMDALPEKNSIAPPVIVHYLLEALLFIILLISWSVSGKRRKKIKELKKGLPKEIANETAEKKGNDTKAEEESIDELLFKMDLPKIDSSDGEQTREIPASSGRSLRDEINEAIGQAPETPQKQETADETPSDPAKPGKPTLDDIFGERK